ncbi:hypothetical protein [Pedobacter frigoris]|uniref:hypothetical protein n=1 Tax=Pedobacter frigoris TaxID=2571272 RepID=UPI00292D78BA|nr:hypothetical protein [Pedobacter frigoris]
MKSTKTLLILFVLTLSSIWANAQDVVMISPGNFVRGTIKGTNFSSVILKNDDESLAQYNAKDIKEFVWNGETYVSKPIVVKKKMEHRFFKLVEQGVVNLYAIGGNTTAEEPQVKRAKVRPNISIGGGTGGFGGVGGGITFGGGRRSSEETQGKNVLPVTYFLEKPGTGPMQELPVEGAATAAKTQLIKTVLLQKLNNDEDLAERINATEAFDAKLLRAFVAAYNSMKK